MCLHFIATIVCQAFAQAYVSVNFSGKGEGSKLHFVLFDLV